jgi:hypothetical protein
MNANDGRKIREPYAKIHIARRSSRSTTGFSVPTVLA